MNVFGAVVAGFSQGGVAIGVVALDVVQGLTVADYVDLWSHLLTQVGDYWRGRWRFGMTLGWGMEWSY